MWVHVNAHVGVHANAGVDANAIANKYVDCVHVRSHLNDM